MLFANFVPFFAFYRVIFVHLIWREFQTQKRNVSDAVVEGTFWVGISMQSKNTSAKKFPQRRELRMFPHQGEIAAFPDLDPIVIISRELYEMQTSSAIIRINFVSPKQLAAKTVSSDQNSGVIFLMQFDRFDSCGYEFLR